MSEKITVLYVEQTGHVLAILTRAADEEAEPVVEELAGEALTVRRLGDPAQIWFPDAQFFVPAAELKAKNVDFKPGVIENPRGFFVDENDEVQPLDSARKINNAVLNGAGTQVTLTVVGVPAAEKAAMWVHVSDQDPAKAQTQTGETGAGGSPATVNISPLSSGTHYVLTLVAKALPNAFKL